MSWLLIIGGTLGLFAVLELAEQRLFIRRPALMIAVAALALRIILTEIAGVYSCTGFHTFFAFIPPVLAYLYIGQRAAYITAAINIALYINWIIGDGPMSWEYIQSENLPVEFFIIVVGMIMMLVLGRTLVLEERNRERAEELFEKLQQSQQQLTELAKVDERNRIARDIHDSVGHHIMAVTVQLEKAMAFRDINPQEADQALLDAKQLVGALNDFGLKSSSPKSTQNIDLSLREREVLKLLDCAIGCKLPSLPAKITWTNKCLTLTV